MPEEQTNSMERRLQAAAQKRRQDAGEPLTLPAVQRRQLHDEAARLYRRPENTAPPRPSLTRWIPWLAWSGSVAALVAVVTITLRYQPHPVAPALGESSTRSQSARFTAPDAAPKTLSSQPNPALSPATPPPPSETAKPAPIRVQPEENASPANMAAPMPSVVRARQNAAREQSVNRENTSGSPSIQRDEMPPASAAAPQNQLAATQNQMAQPAARYDQRAANQASQVLSAGALDNQARPNVSQDRFAGRLNRSANASQNMGVSAGNSTSQMQERLAPPTATQNAVASRAAPEPAPSQSTTVLAPTAIPVDALTATPERRAPYKSKLAPPTGPGLHFKRANARPQLRQNLLSPPNTKILSSFELIQEGRQLRLVDYDGSVYEGMWVAQETPAPAPTAHPFKLSGVNRTTGQGLELSGALRLSPKRANTPATPQATAHEPARDPISLLEAAKDWSLRLEGRAVLGGSNRWDWTAVPGDRR